MASRFKRIDVSEFKARCLSVIEEASRTGHVLALTHHGRTLARVVPERVQATLSLLGAGPLPTDIPAPHRRDWPVDPEIAPPPAVASIGRSTVASMRRIDLRRAGGVRRR